MTIAHLITQETELSIQVSKFLIFVVFLILLILNTITTTMLPSDNFLNNFKVR